MGSKFSFKIYKYINKDEERSEFKVEKQNIHSS